MAVVNRHSGNFAATPAASPITIVRGYRRIKSKGPVRAVAASFRGALIRKVAAQPVDQGFFGQNSEVRPSSPTVRTQALWIGVNQPRFRPLNCASACKNSGYSQVWSTAGYRLNQERLLSGGLRETKISLTSIFLRMSNASRAKLARVLAV